MGSEWEEVQEMLHAIAVRLRSSPLCAMSHLELSTALNSLHTMGGGWPVPMPPLRDLSGAGIAMDSSSRGGGAQTYRDGKQVC